MKDCLTLGHKLFGLGVADLRGDFSLVSAICLWWDLGTLLALPVLTSTECRRSIPESAHLKIRLWHPAKGCDALNDFKCQNLVCAQDFYLLSLIMIPPKRKAQLFSMLDILGGSQTSALKGSSHCRPAAELGIAPGSSSSRCNPSSTEQTLKQIPAQPRSWADI